MATNFNSQRDAIRDQFIAGYVQKGATRPDGLLVWDLAWQAHLEAQKSLINVCKRLPNHLVSDTIRLAGILLETSMSRQLSVMESLDRAAKNGRGPRHGV